MAYARVWSDSTPVGADQAKLAWQDQQHIRIDLRERLMSIFTMPDFTSDPLKVQVVNLGYGVSTKGGYVALTDDTGTLRWQAGLRNSAGGTTYAIRDIVAAADRLQISSTGLVTVAQALTVLNGDITVGADRSFILTPNGTDAQYLYLNSDATGIGKVIIQAGAGSAGFGGALNLYSHSHASHPGDVVAGISSGSGGKFRVNSQALDAGANWFTVSQTSVSVPSQLNNIASVAADYVAKFIQSSGAGYGVFITPGSDSLEALTIVNAANTQNAVRFFGSGNIVQSAGYIDSTGIRIAGSNVPATGAGLELLYGSNIGTLQAYDRGASTYKQVDFQALNYRWIVSSTIVLQLNSSNNLLHTGPLISTTGYLTVGAYGGSAVSAGDLVVRRSSTTGIVYFGDSGSKYFYYDGTVFIISGGNLQLSGSLVANVIGNVNGNVTGNVTGNLTGNVTGNVTGTSGSTTGNALTATTLQTARNINGVAFDGSANITVTAAAGTLTGAALASNVLASSLTSVGVLAAPHMTSPVIDSGSLTGNVTGNVTGNLTGNVTGNVSGSSGSTTGNAATATILATARAINGVNFDGSAPITVAADANTLTNTTLHSTVVTSSLTTVGALVAGSIASGFGTISTANSISTTAALSGGKLFSTSSAPTSSALATGVASITFGTGSTNTHGTIIVTTDSAGGSITARTTLGTITYSTTYSGVPALVLYDTGANGGFGVFNELAASFKFYASYAILRNGTSTIIEYHILGN